MRVNNLTNTDIDSLKNKVLLFYKSACDRRFVESIDESHDGYEMAEFINRKHSEFQKVKILIITNKRLSKSVKEVRETEHDLPLNLSYDIWDLTRFYQLEVSHGNSEAIVITIEDLKKPLAAILASSTSDITSYLVVVPGEMLANLYERFGSKLMESNVRSFLQFRAGVNKGIRKTILTEPEKFFAYNNGITVTAESVRFNDESKIIQLNNLQIVNGGQTTVSLYQTRKDRRADLSQIHVQMKLNIVGNSKVTDEIVPNISRYANSQNKISDSDFFSNHPYHRRFESQALRIWAPGSIRQSKWFYERARGSYLNAQANLTSSQKLAFQSENPKDQLITKIDLAKLYLIFNDKPYLAVRGAEIAFRAFAGDIQKIWEEKEGEFNDEYFKQTISQMIAWQACKKVVYKNKDFLGNTKAIVSAYTVAVFSELIKDRYLELDYNKIWRDQMTPEVLPNVLEKLSKFVYQYLDFQALNKGVALLSYSKSEKAYDDVKQHSFQNFKFEHSIIQYLNKRFTQEQSIKSAKEIQKIDNEVVLMKRLISIGPLKWEKIVEDCIDNNWLTSPDELNLLKMIPKYMKGELRKTPTLKQLEKIENILLKFEDYDYFVYS